jgi:hypothetical protein
VRVDVTYVCATLGVSFVLVGIAWHIFFFFVITWLVLIGYGTPLGEHM